MHHHSFLDTVSTDTVARKEAGHLAKQRAEGTRHIRVLEDLAEKLGWINEIDGDSANDVIEPLVRAEVERRYAAIEKRVEIIKAARAGDVPDPAFANDLGDPGA